MDKLGLKFWRNKNVVMMEVIQQDESLRGAGGIFNNTEDYMIIKSSRQPDLSFSAIFIRGDVDVYDNKVSCICLYTESDAKDYLERCVRTIRKYNNNLIIPTQPTEEKKEEINMLIV